MLAVSKDTWSALEVWGGWRATSKDVGKCIGIKPIGGGGVFTLGKSQQVDLLQISHLSNANISSYSEAYLWVQWLVISIFTKDGKEIGRSALPVHSILAALCFPKPKGAPLKSLEVKRFCF